MANEGYGNYETDETPAKDGARAPGKPSADKPSADKGAEKGADEGGGEKPVQAAGPHAKPELTNHAATPGAGAMPEGPAPGGDVDPGAG